MYFIFIYWVNESNSRKTVFRRGFNKYKPIEGGGGLVTPVLSAFRIKHLTYDFKRKLNDSGGLQPRARHCRVDKVKQGGFNPYGNGQPVCVQGLVIPTVAGVNLSMFTAPADGVYDFGYVNVQTWVEVGTANWATVAWSIVVGNAAYPTFGGAGTATGMGTIPATSVLFGQKSVWGSSAGNNQNDYLYLGPITLQAGTVVRFCAIDDNIGALKVLFSTGYVNVTSTTISGVANVAVSGITDVAVTNPQTSVSITGVPSVNVVNPQVVSVSGVVDTNVVGFGQTNNPVWISTTNPLGPVIDPNMSSAVLEGSFNPYGNGQTSVSFKPSRAHILQRDRQSPYSEDVYTFEAFTADIVSACNRELCPASRDYAKHIADPAEYSLQGFGAGYQAEQEDGPQRSKIDQHHSKAAATGLGGAKSGLAVEKVRAGVLANRTFDLNKQKGHVIMRISRRMKNWEDMLRWLTCGEKPDQGLASGVYRECLKAKDFKGKETADYYACTMLVEGRRAREVLIGYGNYSRSLLSLINNPNFNLWAQERFHSDNQSRVLSGSDSVYSGSKNVSGIMAQAKVSAYGTDGLMEEKEESVDPDMSDSILQGSFNPYGNEQIDYDHRSEVLQGSFNPYGNGQPNPSVFPNSMQEVVAGNDTVNALFEASGGLAGPVNNPVDDVIELTGLRNAQGITMSSVPREIHARGGTISASNVITPVNTLNSPESLLWPVNIANCEDPYNTESPRFSTYGLGLVRRRALHSSVLSANGAILQEIVSRSGNIRPSQITGDGFLTQDCAALTRLEPETNGDSICSLLLKSYLYEKTRCWNNDLSQLPLGCEPGKFDGVRLAPNSPVTLHYNNSTFVSGYNINCEAEDDYVFPYVAGDVTPQIAFHVCKASIPDNEPFFMVKPGLLLQNDAGNNMSINLALLAMLLAPYPCGLHTVDLDTIPGSSDDPADAVTQTFMPFSDQIHIPGVTSTIHLYLPNKTAEGPPNSQNAANSAVLVRPTTGPTAVNALPANSLLNVSFVGTVVRYNLANYLYSWMALPNSPIDITTIARFRRNVCELSCRYADLNFAWELSCCLSTRYPCMVNYSTPIPDQLGTFYTPVTDESPVPFFNIEDTPEACFAMQNWFGLEPTPLTTDIPQALDEYDLYIPDMNGMWWNKIMSGMYDSVSDIARTAPRDFDGSVRSLQYTLSATREYTVTSEYIFTYMQQGSAVWNAAFEQLDFTNVLAQIRDFFTESRASGSDAMVSNNGHAASLLHNRVNGSRPSADMFGYTIWDYINAPRVGFLSVYDQDGVALTNCVPSILPDIWVQLNSEVKTLEFTPLLSTNKLLTGVPLEDGRVVPIGGGSYSTPMADSESFRTIGLESVPILDAKTLFNARLGWHAFVAGLFLLDGTVFNTGVPTAGVVCQKALWPDWTVTNNIGGSILTASTRWMPYMTTSGLRITVGVTAANGASLMTQVMAGKTTTGVATWLLHNVQAMPNTIISSSGRNTKSRIAQRPGRENSSASSTLSYEDGQRANM